MQLTVLLPTYNGAQFLQAQLDSISAQSRLPDKLVVSDDGSQDATCAILARFARTAPFEVSVQKGPGAGLARNMQQLLAGSAGGLVALADQDDVWFPHKLTRACAQVGSKATPSLYAARRVVTDARLNRRRLTRIPRKRCDFAHALRRNIAPGNTLVLNPAAAELAAQAATQATACANPLPAFHDWWLYQLVTGAGGTAIFDPNPVLLYRQHEKNLFGASTGLYATTRRFYQRFNGTYTGWLRAQCATLDRQRNLLTPQAIITLDHFMDRITGCHKHR